MVLERLAEEAIKTGFKNVILMQDHGGGTNVYGEVAKKLDAKYASQGIHVYFCDEVYAKAQGDFDRWLAANGYPVSSHAGIPDTSEMWYLGGDLWTRSALIPTAVGDTVARGADSRPERSTCEQRHQRRRAAFVAGARKARIRTKSRLRGQTDPRIPRDEMIMSDSLANLTRRQFVLTAAAAVVIRPRSLVLPSDVEIVEFSASGQRLRTVRVPEGRQDGRRVAEAAPPGLQFEITRQERNRGFPLPASSWDLHDKWVCLRCICCDTALFSSDGQSNSGTGWPSFWQPIAEENVHHGKPSAEATSTAKSRVVAATHTSAICSTMGRSRQGCGTASTRRRYGL